MDDNLFVFFPPIGNYVVFFVIPFELGLPAIKYHEVIGIIITDIATIFIVYIFNFDTAFGFIPIFMVFCRVFIPSCTVFGRVSGICCSCYICYIRYNILVFRRFSTRFLINWIFLLYIGCIVSVKIDYLRRPISGISTSLMLSLSASAASGGRAVPSIPSVLGL